MKAYKIFNSDWTCKGFKYEIGKTYKLEGELSMCSNGFHACVEMANCFRFYSNSPENKYAIVELGGQVLGEGEEKQCASEITVVEEISHDEAVRLSNTGIGNTGISNSGDRNSGNWNSGNRNSGDWNSGNWNSGDWNSGYFNTITPDKILVFNRPCKRNDWDKAQKPDLIYFELTDWVSWADMSEDEKKAHPKAYVCDGYLKTYEYKEAWKRSYENATPEDIELLKALPNFDADVFEKISGIKIEV